MPVEIREIIIRATVGNPNQGGSNNAAPPAEGEVSSQEIIQEAVEQVMQLIQDKNER